MIYLGLLLPWVPAGVQADGLRDAVVYPSAGAPESVGKDHVLELHVTLRLPLTPPPGVQQKAAIKDWRVILKNNAPWTRTGKKAQLKYKLPVMRIRPLQGDTYRIQVELPPWLPDGQYDAVVEGPGFKADAPQSVRLIGTGNQGPIPAITLTSTPGEMVLHNSLQTPLQGTFQILLDKQEMGVTAVLNEVTLTPVSVTFARFPIDGSRVLTFAVEVPQGENGKPGLATVRIQQEPAIPCSGEIALSPAAPNDATAYRDVRFTSNKSPHSLVWDFGDGRFGTGNPVRHRFLLTNEAKITAWALDSAGRICTAATDAAMNEPANPGGCSCITVGQ